LRGELKDAWAFTDDPEKDKKVEAEKKSAEASAQVGVVDEKSADEKTIDVGEATTK
jgi:hypothetical protein